MRSPRSNDIPSPGGYRRRSGSALLLVVGLLVILAMLGTTFLLVCRLDARQANALAQKAPADPLAGGILQRVCALLESDLHIGANGPYDATSSGPAGWRQFIDSPSYSYWDAVGSVWVNVILDDWLATNDLQTNTVPPVSCTYSRLSNPGGMFLRRHTTSPVMQWNSGTERWDVNVWNPDTSSWEYQEAVDTDGDGWADALLYDTGVKNEDGETYHAAVRIIDLSGLLNVNTAAGDDGLGTFTMPAITSPVHIDLLPLLHEYYYDVHAERSGVSNPGATDLADFYTRSASRLLQPDGSYLPFAIGDEMFLRWLQPINQSPPTAVGRLHDILVNTPDDNYRAYLTTWNCSRSLPRHPDANWNRRTLLDSSTALDDPLIRDALYGKLNELLGDQEQAAHFVANLWAYLSPLGSLEAPFEFSAEGTFTVYGLMEPEVFITEAYVRAKNDGDGDRENEVHALELTNVSSGSADLDDYELQVSGTGTPIPLSGTLVAGGKDVFYTFTHGSDMAFLDLADATNSHAVTGLDLTQDIWLFKTVNVTNVPIDIFRAAQLGYTDLEVGTEPEHANAEAEEDIRRDDILGECRYLVAAAYVKTSIPATQRLGQPNGVTFADPEIAAEADYPVVVTLTHGSPVDLGELQRVFLTGPYESGTGTYTPFTERISSFSDDPARGRLDLHPASVNPGTTYPDVPYAAMMAEMFELLDPDGTRLEGSTDAFRIYGKVNINTATREVLRMLPWPTDDITIGSNSYTVAVESVIDYILAYRHMHPVAGGPNYGNRNTASAITGLRNDPQSQITGFLTPGEIAVPLGDYFNNEFLTWDGNPATITLALEPIVKHPDYPEARDSLYRAVSNLITVNSDVFAVNIRIQLRDDLTDKVKGDWYYVAVIDRSNCRTTGHSPAVLLFSQVE